MKGEKNENKMYSYYSHQHRVICLFGAGGTALRHKLGEMGPKGINWEH